MTAEPIRQILIFAGEHAPLLRTLAFASLAFFILTPIAVPVVLVLMPEDALLRHRPARGPGTSSSPHRVLLYWLWHLLKNILGAALLALGFLLLFLPGQGLLTMLAGLLLADIPGKKRLLAKVLGARGVRGSVNRLRHRYGRPPLSEEAPRTGK